MVRSIVIEFPSINSSVRADLWEELEPELCKALWANLGEPIKMVCRHPVSSGQEFSEMLLITHGKQLKLVGKRRLSRTEVEMLIGGPVCLSAERCD